MRAEHQTKGRGRQGRGWEAPTGNLSASTLIRLHAGEPSAPTLALVAAIALAETIEAFAGKPTIKWPNDIVIDNAKLSGILLERIDDAVVIGFGINLAHHPNLVDRPTTSLAAAVGHSPDPDAFLVVLAEVLERWIGRWRNAGVGPVRAAWLKRAHPIGAALSLHLPDGEMMTGLFDGLDESGALRLRLADGSCHVIHAADVFLIRD